MTIGVQIVLFNGTTPRANLSDIDAVLFPGAANLEAGQAIWAPKALHVTGLTTAANGALEFLTPSMAVGDTGLLVLRKTATPDSASLSFQGVVTIVSGLNATARAVPQNWTRPVDWPALPAVVSTNQKLVGLVAVYDTDAEYIAFQCAGNYTVDWGDGGATENVAANTTAEHKYNYATLGTAVTSRGYKTALITITPQSGQNLTSIDLSFNHTIKTSGTGSANWLDITVAAPNATTLKISSTSVRRGLLEQCTILSHATTTMTSMFHSCYSLQSVPLFNTASVTTMTSMFQGCYSLQSVPLFNTASVTTMTSMFQGCYSLQSVPLFNTASVTTMTSMFQGCYSLQSVPLFNTASVTAMTNMFHSCISLQSVPLFNTASVTNMANMFYSCYSFKDVPLFNIASVTNMAGMFYSCYSLQSVPLFNTASVTNMTGMFNSCISLQNIPALVQSAITTAATDFANGANGLGKSLATGMRYGLSYLNCELTDTAIDEIFTNLGTAAGAQTIIVTGNPGAATCTTSIATAKGWTVTV